MHNIQQVDTNCSISLFPVMCRITWSQEQVGNGGDNTLFPHKNVSRKCTSWGKEFTALSSDLTPKENCDHLGFENQTLVLNIGFY